MAITRWADSRAGSRAMRSISGSTPAGQLSSAAQLDVSWLYRDSDPANADIALEAAVRAEQLPNGSGRIYVGCEAAAMRRIRSHLLQERGLDPTTIVTRGYWKLGDVNYTDHDYGTDD